MARRMEEAISLMQKLGGVGFGTLLALILYGGYAKIWVWGSQYAEMKADYESRLAQVYEEKRQWQAATRDAAGLAQHGVVLARQQIEKGPAA